jgi:hypothetical protein
MVASAMIGFVFLLAVFTFPETAYVREKQVIDEFSLKSPTRSLWNKSQISVADDEPFNINRSPPKKQSYLSSLKVFHRTLTTESFLKLVIRPLGLICLPPVLWAALVQSVTIGFLVAVTSNVDVAFEAAYGFQSWQVGLCFVAAIVGSLIAVPSGGYFGDVVADWFTKRNGGIRDPEMRLPAILPSLITTPLALILYGVGVQRQLHWICPTIGLGLCKWLCCM